MTEILTESFCERCGTRYTFESSAPRKSRLGRVRVLGKGMRNFVLSDDSSLSEAMADARSEEEINATAHQLDAFHQTFNFCLTCRQYTCGDCWNNAEGRCLTCAPVPGMELPEPAALAPVALDAPELVEATNGHAADEPWPDADLSSARLARALGMDDADVELVADEIAQDELVPDVVADADDDADEVSAASALIGIEPGQSLEDAIADYESRLDADEAAAAAVLAAAAVTSDDTDEAAEPVAAAPEPEPVAVAELEPVLELAPEPEPEPVVATAEPIAAAPDLEPEPVVAAEPEIAAEPEPEPVAAAPEPPREDVVPQPAWPVPSAPSTPPGPVPPTEAPQVVPWLTVAPEDSETQPQWPVAPAWPAATNRRDVPNTLAGRPLLPPVDPTGLWAASAREVLTGAAQPMAAAVPTPTATAQPCVSCGLSLSANARFCRRCGTRQG